MTFLLEIIGTVAFAVSGATVGVDNHMDIFGVSILGLTGAVGGGIIRDLILNMSPPAAFQMPVYAFVAIAVSLLVFMPAVRRFIKKERRILLIMDSIGLGIFTVIGVKAAADGGNMFLALFVGITTGVGGGVLRDIFAGSKPMIFVKHFYASASLVGALLCVCLWRFGENAAMSVGAAAVIILRLLAAKYHWKLPRA